MTWGLVAVGVGTVAAGAYSANKASKAAGRSADATLAAAEMTEERLQRGYEDAEGRLSPFIGSELAANRQLMIEMGLTPPPVYMPGSDRKLEDLRSQPLQGPAGPAAQPGTAYMQTPAYKAAMEEGIGAVNQGAAGAGALYSGSRGLALRDVGQSVQQSFYNNYMNILQSMANPTTATNLSNIGIGVAGSINDQNALATTQANNARLAGQQASGAVMSDVVGGIGSAVSAYLSRPQTAVTAPAATSSTAQYWT